MDLKAIKEELGKIYWRLSYAYWTDFGDNNKKDVQEMEIADQIKVISEVVFRGTPEKLLREFREERDKFFNEKFKIEEEFYQREQEILNAWIVLNDLKKQTTKKLIKILNEASAESRKG